MNGKASRKWIRRFCKDMGLDKRDTRQYLRQKRKIWSVLK